MQKIEFGKFGNFISAKFQESKERPDASLSDSKRRKGIRVKANENSDLLRFI